MGLNSNARGKVSWRLALRLLFSIAPVSIITSAQAADVSVPFLKAPPVVPDLTWNGITLIGAIDVSGQYESHGAPYVGMQYGSASQISPFNRGPYWLFAPSQELQSFVGLKVDEALTNDVHFIARIESGFNPTTGDLSDGLKSLQKSNGIPLSEQNHNGDGSRAGQILNGEAWAGFDANTWGTLHAGRNNAVSFDMLAAYDPQLSYAFSPHAYVGYAGGQGSSETGRVDDSVKYLNNFGPFRTELMYGAPGTNVRDFFQGSVGFVKPNFSVDVFGGRAHDEVSAGALGGASNLGSSFLGARVYDTFAYGAFAKYVFDVGGKGLQDPSDARFILSGGFDRIDFSNPSDGGYGPGHVTIGDYVIGPNFSTNGSASGGVVNYAYTGGDRVIDDIFIAGKYQHNQQWSASVGYYFIHQNSFGFGINSVPGVASAIYSNVSCSTSSFTNCSGLEQVVSFHVDFDWTKNVRLYAGVAYSRVSGGLQFGYLHNDEWDPTVGVRCMF